MANRDRLNQAFRQAVGDLDRGGVSDLVYTTIRDHTTGETSYIDGNGNPVSQEQVDAQNAAMAAIAQIPEMTAEEVLQVESDGEEMQGYDGNNDTANDFHPINRDNNGEMGGPDDHEDDPEEETSAEEDNNNDGSGQKADKQPISTKKRPAPQGGAHRDKRWSETKSWQKIIIAENAGQCPDNIDDLVRDAERVVGKKLKDSYKERVARLKAIGFNDKMTELQQAQARIEELETQLGKARTQVKKYKGEITKLKTQPTKTTPVKGEKPATPKTAPTKSLNLPPSLQSRPTMTAPLSTAAYTALPDTIIEAGINMIRATGEKDWPERARNWVVLAESRPRFEFK
jgi:hypothetical protein